MFACLFVLFHVLSLFIIIIFSSFAHLLVCYVCMQGAFNKPPNVWYMFICVSIVQLIVLSCMVVCMYVCMYLCSRVFICFFWLIGACVSVCVCVCVCVLLFIYLYTKYGIFTYVYLFVLFARLVCCPAGSFVCLWQDSS